MNNSKFPLLADIFQKKGKPMTLSGNRPILLEGKDKLWYISTGTVEIFVVRMMQGLPTGERSSHLLTRSSEECMFGIDSNIGFGFWAIGVSGTKVYQIDYSLLKKYAVYKKELAKLADDWILGLSKNITQNLFPFPRIDIRITDEEQILLNNNQKIRSGNGVLWLKAQEGKTLFISREYIFFGEDVLHFPLTPYTWIETITENIDLQLEANILNTADALVHRGFQQDFLCFHKIICDLKVTQDKIHNLQETNWLRTKSYYAEAAKNAAFWDIASVLDKTKETVKIFDLETEDREKGDPVFKAAKLVGDYQDIKIEMRFSETGRELISIHDKINAIAKASRFRFRKVTLRNDWYEKDHGPMLGSLAETGEPVALLPISTNAYEAVYPASGGKRLKVDKEIANELSHVAFSFYRPLPEMPDLKVTDLIKFGAKHLRKDFYMLLAMGVLIGIMGTLTPLITGQIFDSVIPQAEKNLLFYYSLALFVAAAAKMAFEICRNISVLRVQSKMDYSLQAALWDRLLNLPMFFFRKYSAGDLYDRVMGIAKIRDLIAGAGVSAILGGMTSIFYIILMFKYSLALTLIGIGITLILMVFIVVINILRLRHQNIQLELNGKINGLVLQLVSGISKLRVAGAENFAFRQWANNLASYRKISIDLGKIDNLLTVIQSGFPIFSLMVIFGALAWLQRKEESEVVLSTGEFIAYSSAFGFFQSAMLALCDTSMNLFRIIPIYERMKPITTTSVEVDDFKNHPGELSGEIEASHLHFRYSDDGPLITKDVTFRIRPGEFVAFVGGSGSGKSTLMRLMLGFEKPEAGSIYYDKQDLSTLDLREVRQQIGVVLQNSQVMPGSVYENIVGNTSLSVNDAWDAAHMAGLAEDIKQMPMGMHTVVSEGGGTLSGGQRQRLMIARALVRKPKIVFLDEATSALDNRTQAQVTESMDKLETTRIVIAHRLSTIINADRIYVLELGEIIEEGNYRELMAKNGIFSELAKRQIA